MGVSTTWTGASSSAYDTAGNWTNGVPISAGTAVIDGSVSITGGVPSQPDVQRFYVARTYTGAIGSVGTPLELDCAELSVDNTTSGSTHYIHLDGATHASKTAMVDGLKTGNALYLSGDLDLVIVESTFLGTVHLGNSASKVATVNDMTIMTSAGTVDASVPANVAFVTGAVLYMTAGTFNIGENFGTNGTLTLTGGTVNVNEWTATTGDSLVVSGSGATVNWNAGSTGLTPSSVNTVNTLTMVNGTFTTVSNEKAYVGLGTITQFGGTVNLQSPFPNIEINTAFNTYAGSFNAPKQSVITTTAK
jgi:fibronectin-binding autotransporter adhesin